MQQLFVYFYEAKPPQILLLHVYFKDGLFIRHNTGAISEDLERESTLDSVPVSGLSTILFYRFQLYWPIFARSVFAMGCLALSQKIYKIISPRTNIGILMKLHRKHPHSLHGSVLYFLKQISDMKSSGCHGNKNKTLSKSSPKPFTGFHCKLA